MSWDMGGNYEFMNMFAQDLPIAITFPSFDYDINSPSQSHRPSKVSSSCPVSSQPAVLTDPSLTCCTRKGDIVLVQMSTDPRSALAAGVGELCRRVTVDDLTTLPIAA